MRLFDELRSEHELIERLVGSLRTWVTKRANGLADAADAATFLRFFTLFARDFHHEREEQVLLSALVREVELPRDRGPIAEILRQHEAMSATLAAVSPVLLRARWTDEDRGLAVRLTHQYCDALLQHIDAENSVLFPESEARLVRRGAGDLAARPPTEPERQARVAAEALLQRHPPTENRELMRGDGCVMCPAFGERCDGVEREWWTDAEWESVRSRGGVD